jgi:hypothetical protein
LVAGGLIEQGKSSSGGKHKKYTNQVEQVFLHNGQLQSKQKSALPGSALRAFSLVALNDGRVMLLGGSSSQYFASSPIRQTYFLDVDGNTWAAGPDMLEARTGAAATLMPDGSVLVTGGWTPQNTWSDSASRTTERWIPDSNSFESGIKLPLGLANHQINWLPKKPDTELFVSGGWLKANTGNPSVLILDVEKNRWRESVDQCFATRNEMLVLPFEFNQRPLLWCQSASSANLPWKLVSLTKYSNRFYSDGIALNRHGIGYVPAIENIAGLAAGGIVERADSAFVEALWLDGRFKPLAPLNHARRYAQVFRLNDGSFLVAGGDTGDRSRRSYHVPPVELLPGNVPLEEAEWKVLEMDSAESFGKLKDGSLLGIYANGTVKKLSISLLDDKPVIEQFNLPSLNRARISSNQDYDSKVEIKELSDGRIIVAGGKVQHHKMALLTEKISDVNVPDQFVTVGEYRSAHQYEIYNLVENSWTESAYSASSSDRVAILDDGRVVKWGKVEPFDYWENRTSASTEAEPEALLEISDKDGKSWQKFSISGSLAQGIANIPELFTIQGELFVLEQHYDKDTIDVLHWFNPESNTWEEIWRTKPDRNWRNEHVGQFILHDFPNGKRIFLPVDGLSGRGAK